MILSGIDACSAIPWIPEPSTVNNKLKCREGSGIQGSSATDLWRTETTRVYPPAYDIIKDVKRGINNNGR